MANLMRRQGGTDFKQKAAVSGMITERNVVDLREEMREGGQDCSRQPVGKRFGKQRAPERRGSLGCRLVAGGVTRYETKSNPRSGSDGCECNDENVGGCV